MIITTTESIPGKEIKEVYGLVTASTVRKRYWCRFKEFSWWGN